MGVNIPKFIAARDSLYDEDQMKQKVQTEMLYNFEKEMQQTKLEQAKRDIQVKEETRRQKLQLNFLIFAFLVVLAVAILII